MFNQYPKILLKISNPQFQSDLQEIMNRWGVEYVSYDDSFNAPLNETQSNLKPEKNNSENDLLGAIFKIKSEFKNELRENLVNSVLVTDSYVEEGPFTTLNLLSSRRPSQEEISPFASANFRHWIGVNSKGKTLDERIDQFIFLSTILSIRSARFLRLYEILGDGALIETYYADASDHREKLIHRLENICEEEKVKGFVKENLVVAFDEIFTNAIYNAPVNDLGIPIFASESRKQKVTSPKPIMIQFGWNEHDIAIAIRDNYGTLPIQRVTDCWERCWKSGGAKFEEKEGGAGLGFYMLMQNAKRLVVNIKEGVFTEIIFSLPIKMKRGAFLRSSPNMNLCTQMQRSAISKERQHDRYSVYWRGILKYENQDYDIEVLDFSNGGAFIANYNKNSFHLGKVVQLLVYPPKSQEPLVLNATLRWIGYSDEHNSSGMGLQFHSLINAPNILSQNQEMLKITGS